MTKSVGVIRLLWLVGLVALAAVIALVVFARTSEPTPSPQSCTAPDYEKGALYEQGQQVQHAGQQFECWKDDEAPLGVGSWQWCKLPVYEPLVAGGPWKDAWKELGECDGFEGNRLTLSFATLSGKAPLKPAVPGVARADQIVTGTLRCKAEEIAISATAKGLAYGKYQLRLNDVKNWIPVVRNTSVTLSETSKSQSINLQYRERPVKLEVKVTIKAPAKPASVTDTQWHFSLVDENQSNAEPRVVKVPWGGSSTQLLDYGNFKFIYPFYPKENS